MQIPSRFTIAIHMLACMEIFQGSRPITSDFMAGSINANPVIIRQILLKLKAAGLVCVKRGRNGASLARPLASISFYDVYRAMECLDDEELFRFHENPNPLCPVGRNIHAALEGKLKQVQRAMENELKNISVAEVVEKIRAASP